MSSPTSFVSPPSSPVPSSITLTNTAVNPIPTTPSDPESAERSLLGEPIPIASPYNNQAVLLQAIVNQMEAEEAEEIANALATHLPSSSSPSLQGLPPSPPARTEPPSPMPELISSRPSSPATSVASYWNPDPAQPTFEELPFDYLVKVIKEISRPSSHAPRYYARPYGSCLTTLSTLDQLKPDFLQFVVNPINNIHLDRAAHMVRDKGIIADLLRFRAYYHHHEALVGFQAHVARITQTKDWTMRQRANRLVNAHARERLLPLLATEYAFNPPSSPVPPVSLSTAEIPHPS